MSGTTNVPAPTFGATGFVAPAESLILAGRQADINAALGGGLNPALTTPQGQLASSDAAIIGNCYTQFAAIANGVDPAFASGRMQDAIGRIYFLQRVAAAPTVAQVTCSGAGATIPVGATITAADGNLYSATASGTIPAAGGSIVLPFACQVTGPIVCPAQTFTIYQTIGGWDSATSAAAGTPGNAVESRNAFESRRAASVASNSAGFTSSILGAVLAVPGVLDAYVADNANNYPVAVGGVTLAANSVYVAVVGGVASAVAQAIWSKKPPGCVYNGSTTVTVYDPNPAYTSPPAYNVSFTIPTATTILFAVSIANGPSVPANAGALIAAAIVAAAAGNDGGPPMAIGSMVYASRFYAPVAAVGAWVRIISIQVGLTSAGYNDVAINIDQMPVVSAANVALTLV